MKLGINFFILVFLLASDQIGAGQIRAQKTRILAPRKIPSIRNDPSRLELFSTPPEMAAVAKRRSRKPLPVPFHGKSERAQSVAKIPAETVVQQSGNFVQVDDNIPLENISGISKTAEPTVAVRDQDMLVTGNWFAAVSHDSGKLFEYRDPYAVFGKSPQGTDFCCDQVAIYDPRSDLMVWLLQYEYNAGSQNTWRLAVAKGRDIENEEWYVYDLTPEIIGGWYEEWFDYPDIVIGENFLYLSANLYDNRVVSDQNPAFRRALVMKIPLAAISTYRPFDLHYFHTYEVGSMRGTQGAGNVMYWGATYDSGTLEVFSWPENVNLIQNDYVTIDEYSFDTPSAPAYCYDWLGGVDPRITAGWATSGTIGFAWSVAEGSGFPKAHVRAAILDRGNPTKVVRQPHIWSNDYGFAYPSAAVNSLNEVGISLHFGGGTYFPTHAVGLFDSVSATWDLVAIGAAQSPPNANEWGDYLATHIHGRLHESWITAGFSIEEPQSNAITVRYIRFSRKADTTAEIK